MSELLSLAEIESLISKLTVADRTRLIRIVQKYEGRIKYEPEDLVNEALCRVLDERRSWPRRVETMPFLVEVIKSIASEWKQDLQEEIDVGDEGVEEGGTLARIDIRRIIALFDDDPIAQKLLMGMAAGAKGEDLQKATGLSSTEYESKRKKIRRRIEQLKT